MKEPYDYSDPEINDDLVRGGCFIVLAIAFVWAVLTALAVFVARLVA